MCLHLNAQVYKAGQMLATYYDIPDTLINYSCATHYSKESYFFDINADNINDFELQAYCGISLGQSSTSVFIKPLNINSFSAFSHNDSVLCPMDSIWYKSKVAKIFANGDTLNSTTVKWENDLLYLTLSKNIMGCPYGDVNDWVNQNDQFIGIKYRDLTDTIYGWIRVNVPQNYNCYIKDYSYSQTPNYVRNLNDIGQKVSIYPNPCNSYFTIKESDAAKRQMQILDMTGQQILSQAIQSGKINIDASGLAQGVYTICISSDEQQINKRLVIVK
ncbi:MAG: T9SS type A sorting domain-containing protein [Bacteroidetes bacterium]|nr:T9SS type A sorting domain-containing protein [Bacteroidota bacterium]